MSENRESAGENPPPAGCVIPSGPNQGDVVPDGHVECFRAEGASEATVHECKGGSWNNTGTPCTEIE